jgi:integrase
MGRPAGKDRIEVDEGLYIYLRDGPNWQVYFKLVGEKTAFRKSLGTKNVEKAKQLARQEYDDAAFRKRAGKSIKKIKFDYLAQDYLAGLTGGTLSYHRDTYNRHLRSYFTKHVPDVSELAPAHISDYLQYRRSKKGRGGDGPTNDTLNRESVVLRGLIKHAVRKGHLSKDAAPELPLLKSTGSRRPAFSRDELAELLKRARERVDETNNQATKRTRQLLYDWIVVMANSGMRPEESLKLTWADIHLTSDPPYIHIPKSKSKWRQVRNTFPQNDAVEQLRELKTRLAQQLSDNGKKLKPDDPVFAAKRGDDLTSIKSFKTAFNSLLDACSFSREKSDGALSPESLRHTYATIRLEEGTDQNRLVDNMGTSAKMIQKHYGHIVLGDFHHELTKTRDQATPSSVSDSRIDELIEKFGKYEKGTSDQVTDGIRKQVLKEWIERDGREPDPTAPGDLEIFEGLVGLKMRELGLEEFYELPDDLPDSLPD